MGGSEDLNAEKFNVLIQSLRSGMKATSMTFGSRPRTIESNIGPMKIARHLKYEPSWGAYVSSSPTAGIQLPTQNQLLHGAERVLLHGLYSAERNQEKPKVKARLPTPPKTSPVRRAFSVWDFRSGGSRWGGGGGGGLEGHNDRLKKKSNCLGMSDYVRRQGIHCHGDCPDVAAKGNLGWGPYSFQKVHHQHTTKRERPAPGNGP